MTENPNAPNTDGNTPIYLAAHSGYTEIVKMLAPFTNNLNAPIQSARNDEFKESSKLSSLLENTMLEDFLNHPQ